MNSKIEYFPDKTIIDKWFYDVNTPSLDKCDNQYLLTDYNIFPDGKIYTEQIQNLIDNVHQTGGGIIIVPKGIFYTGSLFFKQNVHLYLNDGAVLRGSDDINDYKVEKTRIEGETCMYITALINADNVDGFKIFGQGVIDGNGLKSWKSFWLRRKWNPTCKNKDEQRARLIYISNSKNITISGISLINSQFWTNHLYKCQYVKFLNCNIYSPKEPIKAPSTDAVDIDVCSDVLVKNCYLEVNDDAIALKGGKGPYADIDNDNGINERIIIEDCTYGFCHSCLTCGSESVHNRNIIMRRINVKESKNLLWLKMRPDTPQLYEYISIDDVNGRVNSFLNINPWTQFFDLKDRLDIPLSYANNISISNCNIECDTYFHVKKSDDQYVLSDFKLTKLKIVAKKNKYQNDVIKNIQISDVNIVEKKESN